MTDPNDFFFVQKPGDGNVPRTFIPRSILPGCLVQIDIFLNTSFWTSVERFDRNGNATSLVAFGDGCSFVVLVTNVNHENGVVEGWVGEDLFRFSRKFKIIELSGS